MLQGVVVVTLTFVGAGNYATSSLLPFLRDCNDVDFRGLVTSSGRTAQGLATQFGFNFCASNFEELLASETDAVVVTTRHDTHAESVIKAFNNKKHVYVEKPLALNIDELSKVHKAFLQASGLQLMVGFNRRFSPCTQHVIKLFQVLPTH